MGIFKSAGFEGGECKYISKKREKGVLIIFLGDSCSIKNMVKILGPREGGKYFSRFTQN
jgi:hypothetical protein